jgi:hypothetical protein
MLDIRELMNLKEAYAEVYAPQELTEEQVWEEVEEWVNTLIEEGYDLSDYTWEEMFEVYIEEQGSRGSSTASQTNQSVSGAQIGSAVRSAGNVLAYGNAQGTRPTTQSRQTNVRGGGSRPVTPAAAKPAPAAPILPPPSRPAATAPAAPRPGAPARPAATAPAAAPRPAAATPTRPAASSPAPRPAAATAPAAKPAAMDQWAKANPRLAQAQQIRKQGGSRAEVNKSLYNKGTAAATSTPTVVKAGFDMFDVVKGYLIGEGYADTEEAALAIMINMSEEWRQSIIVEAQVANRDPNEYESKEKQGQSREQQLKGRVMGRMSQMDPDKKAAMLKQMRAVGLDV